MSTAQILLLGALAGCTIFIGLPVARLRNVPANVRSMLAATATGILIFLLWDVLTGAVEPVEAALTAGSDGRFAWLATLLTVGFAGGLVPLVYYDGWIKKRRQKALLGPGAASEAEFAKPRRSFFHLSPAHTLALFIATGIGLHNFSEGLAIGQSAASDQISLAVVLVIGFALHNATEGFGICAPLSGEAEPPSWAFLGVMD
jgi:ZIP family zinc transporter